MPNGDRRVCYIRDLEWGSRELQVGELRWADAKMPNSRQFRALLVGHGHVAMDASGKS